MKAIKRFASLALAMIMALAMTMTAFAATVTVPDEFLDKDGNPTHTFAAYQIFTGTQSESEGALGDVAWGDGIDSVAFLAALKNDATVGSTFTDCTTAANVAEKLSGISDNTDAAKAVAKLAQANILTEENNNGTDKGIELSVGTNTLADGYYLIVDTTAVSGEDMAANAALLQVTGNINITVKTDKPSVEKKVLEDDKYNQDGGYGNGYNDVADYNIGDAVSFKLIGTVPDMTYYDTYKYVFHDSMSDGLTLNAGSVEVYVANDEAGTNKVKIANSNYKLTTDVHKLTVSFTDLKTVSGVAAGKYILVEYTATLNQNAVVGLDGNTNEVYLEYSNSPDQSGEGTPSTGETPEDKVIVFTYELDTTKIDGKDATKKLPGAEFKLHNADGKWAVVNAEGKVIEWADTEEGGSTLTSDASGLFKVIGLDDGTYYLKETKAPAGYNLLTSEITVVITATTTNGQNWTDGVASNALTKLDVTADGKAGTGDTSTGIAGITVANNTGTTLPETGGIGTTIFYILGTILVLGAAVLLVTKKRMSNKQ